MPKLFVYSLRSLWQRRRTTLAAAFGIALVVFVLSALPHAVAGHAADDVQRGQRRSGDGDAARHVDGARVTHGSCGGRARGGGARGQAQRGGSGHGHGGDRRARPASRRQGQEADRHGPGARGERQRVRAAAGGAHHRGAQLTPGTDEALVGKDRAVATTACAGRRVRLAIPRSVRWSACSTGGTAHESEMWTDLECPSAVHSASRSPP